MTDLKFLLDSKEGRAYVARCLIEAFYKNDEIHSSPQSRELFQHESLLVINVVKSRETKQGWIVVGEPPADFIKALPPTVTVEEGSFASKLSELKHLREQRDGLQKRGSELKAEIEKLKNPPTPGADQACR